MAIKLRCSKAAVAEAVLLIASGQVGENPLANYLVSRGMRGPDIAMTPTAADVAAKRPRGARVARKITDEEFDRLDRESRRWTAHEPRTEAPPPRGKGDGENSSKPAKGRRKAV